MASLDAAQITQIPIQIGCQDLLKIGVSQYNGWLRRPGFRNKFRIFAWPRSYVVIAAGCVYCYSNEMARRPECAFSLYRYDKVYRNGEITEAEAPWSFKVVHEDSSYPTRYFSAPSENDMKVWMTCFVEEMQKANAKLRRTPEHDSSFDVPIYQEAGSENIYEECVDVSDSVEEDTVDEKGFVIVAHPDPKRKLSQPPPVPTRPPFTRQRSSSAPQVPVVVNEPRGLRIDDPGSRRSQSFKSTPASAEPDMPAVDRQLTPFRARGSPEGSSMKDEGEEIDAEGFWKSIFFHGSKEEANQIVSQSTEDGMYLVRVNEDNSMVLHVYAKGSSKRFRIYKEDKMYTLIINHKKFKRVVDLIYFYYDNPLPLLQLCLTDCALHCLEETV